ncbi:hypothetical protein [Hespellia stercorisuis]|uniref:Uncharacterized protein n=1 Tax=Hespellia stercorisuis DSM 15480 TaxID=1121950 RepID=A0A1M6RYF6_9FIRM|nr:hypothetical protein [Hespellia stercorisuis]SHK37337.1 hypothetical protein SAMN02745243_02801 [Hespellia stercorisuis DSM 15480]
MQNINELIGIIKGINFDGVINDREVVRLQSWVDKNRNLAYEKYQIELIKMVDSVLEDHMIDDNEKDLMLNTCEEHLKKIEDRSSRIYEINGIVEGVVCDGEVNEAEVLHLKEWMDAYGDSIRGHKPSAELCKAIDDVLEDGIVTEEEQAKPLDMLNTRIRNAQFENKLAYLCKLVKEKKNIGTDLIDILNNESAINEIHSRAESNLMQVVGSYSGYCRNQEIIVVSLVLVAMLEYDGNYYDSVRDTYKSLYERFSEQKVEGKIRSILSKYKKQSESGSRIRIINVALENAIVPQTFLPAFFEFVFDIYKLNFEYDLPEEPYEDFQFVFEGLRNNMLSDGDDISIKVTQKTYKLITATKQLINREDGLDAVIKLSIIIVKLIDRRFWDKDVKIFNPYLKVGYDGWEKTLEESARGGHEHKKSDSELRSHWEPKFLMLNNSVYLNPPAHRVKSQYDYRDIEVVVLNDGKEIYRNNNCDIREIIGGYQVNTEKIELVKPLGKLTYRLVAGNEIIYDSRDKLYRNCIVFNNEGQEVSNNTDFEGTVYIVYKKGEATIDNILPKENYCIGYKLVRMGDAIEIGHDIFNFSSMAKPGVFGQLYSNCGIQKENEDKIIPVYHDDCFVVFEADNSSTKFEIDINGKPHKLSEMQYKVTEKPGSTKYVVELDLQETGIYEIEVNQLVSGRKNTLLQADMVFDTELTYSKEMLADSIYRVQVTSELLDHGIDDEVQAKDFNPGFIQFNYAGIYYSYYIPFDFGFYKLSGCEWCSQSDDLWIDDINDKSVLTLYDSECDGLLLYTESGTLAEDDIKLIDRGYYKQLPVFFLSSYKNGNRYVTLVFTANGKAKHALSCYNKCVIDEEKTEILCFDKPPKVTIKPMFYGKNKVFFEVYNTDEEKILTSKLLESGQISTITDLNSFQEYTIQFYEKTKILQFRKSTLLLEERRTFYAKEDFVGRSYKITEAYFNQIVRGEFVEKQWFFNKYYLKLTDVIDAENGIFEGHVYSKSHKGDFFLFNINPVDVELCSDVIDGTMDIYMTNQGDGLLLDLEHRGILNSMEHPTAPDIFLYAISLKGEDEQ